MRGIAVIQAGRPCSATSATPSRPMSRANSGSPSCATSRGHGLGTHLPRCAEYPALRQALATGPVLKPGMFFTVEPMVNAGRPEVKVLDDGWTAVTRDRSLSAQYEHMVGVTEDGCEVFTLSPAGLMKPSHA